MRSHASHQLLCGQAIRALRVARGLTAKSLAREAGVSYQVVLNIELGHSDGSVAVVRKVLRALDHDLSITSSQTGSDS